MGTTMNDQVYDRDGNPMPWDWWNHGDEYTRWYRTDKRVANTKVGDYQVSTVWLSGIDHQYGDGPPIIFETMIFGGQYDLGTRPLLHRRSRHARTPGRPRPATHRTTTVSPPGGWRPVSDDQPNEQRKKGISGCYKSRVSRSPCPTARGYRAGTSTHQKGITCGLIHGGTR